MDLPQPDRNFYCLDQADMLSEESENAIINTNKTYSKKREG